MIDNAQDEVITTTEEYGATHTDGADHPQAGVAVEGWSDPQSDLATPTAQFGKLILKRNGAATDIEFPVNPPTIIGRFDPGVGPIDIDLGPLPEGSYVSRKHAKIGYDNGAWTIKDLGSSNGTYVLRDDFERVDEAEIHDGQEIALGNARFIFHITAAETALAPDPQ
jgi:pSer/pThr/pTyr-binding forkhead associated (FHA) protein